MTNDWGGRLILIQHLVSNNSGLFYVLALYAVLLRKNEFYIQGIYIYISYQNFGVYFRCIFLDVVFHFVIYRFPVMIKTITITRITNMIMIMKMKTTRMSGSYNCILD